MSSDITLSVKNVGKCYEIYEKPRHRLFQTLLHGRKQFYKEFWALQDISFEVKKGECLGIVGRNGCGKSTLLQIIAGTLQATTGSVEINGRIAALLELGSGFNPEFTGRENVYMNGTVLGLTHKEIDEKCDEIVAFADIGEFIEQPVKTYSSGMFARLAFAVAINVSPDILIVDEILSVGDFAFQNKCMQRIREMKNRGVSIIFVSHDLNTLQLMCDHALWLNGGTACDYGDPICVCQEYKIFQGSIATPENQKKIDISQHDTGMATIIELDLLNGDALNYKDDFILKFAVLAKQDIEEAVFAISIYNQSGDWLIGQTSGDDNVYWPALKKGEVHRCKLALKDLCLAPGHYKLFVGSFSKDISLCYALTEEPVPFSVRGQIVTWGNIIVPAEWKII